MIIHSGFATKYKVDIPIDGGTRTLHDYLAQIEGKRKLGEQQPGHKCLAITPISFRKEYRHRDKARTFHDVGDSLQELASSLSALATSACGKEWWWTNKMRYACGSSQDRPGGPPYPTPWRNALRLSDIQNV